MATRLQSIEPADLAVTVTPMRRRHLRAVLRIEQQVYPRPWSAGLFMGELALRSSRLYLVARVGPTVVGYAGMMLVVDDGHITTIAVDPAWQRLGIGTRLLLCLVRQGVARGVKNLTLEVRMSNLGAQQLYRRFGFAPAGVRRGYYVENAEDALVMWAHDVDLAPTAQRLDGIEAALPGVGRLEGFER
jgi:[ribosomal protein S18]-alanine N-acetyltransferase